MIEYAAPFRFFQCIREHPLWRGHATLCCCAVREGASRFYFVAPAVSMTAALMAFAVVPFGRTSAPPTLLDRRPVTEAEQVLG